VSVSASASARVSSGDVSAAVLGRTKEEAAESKKPRAERSVALGAYSPTKRALRVRLNVWLNLIPTL
jgi:hypothetical protein